MAKDYSNIEGLIGNVKESIRNAYVKGYKQGFNEGQAHQLASDDVFRESCEKSAYEKGLNDAWKCAKKMVCDVNHGGYSLYTLREIFGTASLSDIFLNFSTSETITRIKEYEEKQTANKTDDEIKVGDEVILDDMLKGVILDIDESYIYGLVPSTHLFKEKKDGHFYKRTGRHFDQITDILEQLKEAGHGTDVDN